MKLRTFSYFFHQAMLSLFRNRWMSVAAIATVTVCIFIIGLMSLVVLNSNYIMNDIESNVKIVAFMDEEANRTEVKKVEEQIKAIEGVKEAKLVTKEEGLVLLNKRFGKEHDLVNALDGNNPLPDYYVVRAENKDYVKSIATTLEQIIHVDNVNYGQGVVDRLFAVVRWVRIIGSSIAILLSLGALFLVSTTIRLTVFARKKEIEIMKFVGATDGFIRWPFFIEGMSIGLLGSILAIAVLFFGYDFILTNLQSNISFIRFVNDYLQLGKMLLGLLVGGIVLGAFGSVISIRRFLQV